MKVKPMINGIEVKVGQVWLDYDGCESEIYEVYQDGSFVDGYGLFYEPDGKASDCGSNCNLVTLLKCVDPAKTTYGEPPPSFSAKLRQVQAEAKPKATFTDSEINDKINEVIKLFGWQRAASAYTALNWSWYSVGIPSVGDLVVAGIERMQQAVKIAIDNQEEGYVSSGGLIGRAYITDGELTVQLEMQVTEATSY